MTGLIEQLTSELLAVPPGCRRIHGIAGVPGSGKSTLAGALVEGINGAHPGMAAVVPMDGFHYSNSRLIELGRRDVKGSPQTFDVAGYIAMLRRVGASCDVVEYPIYDRELHDPVMSGRLGSETRIVITEGNYLLLDREPWSELADVLATCWFLETPMALAHERIVGRHVRGGRSLEDAERHYQRSDLANTRLVIACQRKADRVVPCDWAEGG